MSARAPGQDSLSFTPPCLASLVAAPPDGDGWVHEIKFDGYRVQALVANGAARIFTRTGLDWTERFSGLERHLVALPVSSAVIDGEAVVFDERGVARFSLLQRALKRGSGDNIVMMAFDLLHLDGTNVARRPLRERKSLLGGILERAIVMPCNVRYSVHVEGNGSRAFAEACVLGLEGIVSKRIDRAYRSGRHGDWTKAKCVHSDPFVVVGYTLQKKTSKLVGAIVLAFYDGDQLVHAGRVGTGFTVEEARAMADGLSAIRTPSPPFARRLPREQQSGVVWLEPTLVAEVEWRDVTPGGLLRHATFSRFRTDILARDVHRPAAFRHASSR